MHAEISIECRNKIIGPLPKTINERKLLFAEIRVSMVNDFYVQMIGSLITNIPNWRLHLDKIRGTCRSIDVDRAPEFTEPFAYYLFSWYYKSIVLEKKDKNLTCSILTNFKNDTKSLIRA